MNLDEFSLSYSMSQVNNSGKFKKSFIKNNQTRQKTHSHLPPYPDPSHNLHHQHHNPNIIFILLTFLIILRSIISIHLTIIMIMISSSSPESSSNATNTSSIIVALQSYMISFSPFINNSSSPSLPSPSPSVQLGMLIR